MEIEIARVGEGGASEVRTGDEGGLPRRSHGQKVEEERWHVGDEEERRRRGTTGNFLDGNRNGIGERKVRPEEKGKRKKEAR